MGIDVNTGVDWYECIVTWTCLELMSPKAGVL